MLLKPKSIVIFLFAFLLLSSDDYSLGVVTLRTACSGSCLYPGPLGTRGPGPSGQYSDQKGVGKCLLPRLVKKDPGAMIGNRLIPGLRSLGMDWYVFPTFSTNSKPIGRMEIQVHLALRTSRNIQENK